MGRIAQNRLQIVALGDGRWRLHGYILGKQIRKISRNPDELAALKQAKEHELEKSQSAVRDRVLRLTVLTEAQLRDAEAATDRAGGRSLLDYVLLAQKHTGAGEPVLCVDALKAWVEDMAQKKRFPRTIEKNKHRIKAFLKTAKPEHLSDITPAMCERWVFACGSGYTPLTNAAVLRAWLNFCQRRPRAWLAASPLAVDMRDLAHSTRAREAPRILGPDECHRLLRAALAHGKRAKRGRLAGFVILSTWCFMRSAEVLRTTASNLKLEAKTPVVTITPRKRGTVSYRTVTIPANVLPLLRTWAATWLAKEGATVPLGRAAWESVRAAAGMLKLGPARNGRRPHVKSTWQENILRHTGISYFYQACGDITETCRQAGNSDATAFRHYLDLPEEGAAAQFYAAIQS